MVPAAEVSAAKQRSERRISVRLPAQGPRPRCPRYYLRGRDIQRKSVPQRSGLHHPFDVALGSDLEIRIPFSRYASRRSPRIDQTEKDFATSGRVVHVADSQQPGERLIGVQFTGPGSNVCSAPNPRPD